MGIDATRLEEHQMLDTGQIRAVNEVAPNPAVLMKKVSAIDVLHLEATDLGGSNEDVIGLHLGKEYRGRVRTGEQPPRQGIAHHATMARHENLG